MEDNAAKLPHKSDLVYLAHTGLETDLIFNKGIDLPEFAAFPLLETEEGRQILTDYYTEAMAIAQKPGVGVVAETVTWMANKDRAASLGYTPEHLRTVNFNAVKLMEDVMHASGQENVLLSGNIGPQSDGYGPKDVMTATEAEIYHSEQLESFHDIGLDMVSAYTLCYPEEAIGVVRAAKLFELPVVISFTVETDGNLPIGMTLKDAIETVDRETGSGAEYFMINCAHPDHFADVLDDQPWTQRVQGLVVNASRCSHAELDDAEELDAGDPHELAQKLAELRQRFPQIKVVGGCCGTDIRHLTEIAELI